MTTKIMTKEGRQMYAALKSKTKSILPPSPPVPPKQPTLVERQVDFYRTELTELLELSKKVVIDCDTVLDLCESEDEYLKNDAKVAKLIHSRLVIKYTRLLNYQSALDK